MIKMLSIFSTRILTHLKSRSNTVSIDLVGGIGNQLFIYFAGFYLSNHSASNLNIKVHSLHNRDENVVVALNLPHHKMQKLSMSNMRLVRKIKSKISRIISRFSWFATNNVFISKEVGFEPRLNFLNPPIRLIGYFQTYKYFESNKSLFSKYFDQFKFTSREAIELSKEFENESVLMVHIRLGDYLKPENKYFGSLDLLYYSSAIKKATSSSYFSKIVVISDDINSAKNHYFPIENLGILVVWLETPTIKSSVELMMVMRKCKGFIIGNSTFSWWIATLSIDPKIIVAPFPWFKDAKTPDCLYPDNWVQVDSIWRENC